MKITRQTACAATCMIMVRTFALIAWPSNTTQTHSSIPLISLAPKHRSLWLIVILINTSL